MAKLNNSDRMIIAGTAVAFLFALIKKTPPDDPGPGTSMPPPVDVPENGLKEPTANQPEENIIWNKPKPIDGDIFKHADDFQEFQLN